MIKSFIILRDDESDLTLLFESNLMKYFFYKTRLIPLIFILSIITSYAQVKLNGPLVANGFVTDKFLISGEDVGDRVVYIAAQDDVNTLELYSAPIAGGGTSIKLNGNLITGGNVNNFLISGNTVIYTAEQETRNVNEIYAVPITGGTPVKLNSSLPPLASGVSRFSQPQVVGDRIIYSADQDTESTFELYSVPITGGTPTKLNGTITSSGQVQGFIVVGNTVVYSANQDNSTIDDLYAVPATGGISPVKLTGNLLPANSFVSFYLPNEDNSRIVFNVTELVSGNNDVYSVLITGGTPIQLNEMPPIGNSGADFAIPVGNNVVYLDSKSGSVEIYVTPITGGTSTKLNGTLVSGGDVSSNFIVANDTLIYIADQETDNTDEVYSVPITGGTPTKLNGNLTFGGDVQDIRVSGNRLIYSADQEINNTDEVYSVPITGGTPTKISGSDVDVFELSISPNANFSNLFSVAQIGDVLVYLAEEGSVDELYAVPTTGGNAPIKINSSLVSGGDVGKFLLSDGKIYYIADQDTDNQTELYVTDLPSAQEISLNQGSMEIANNSTYDFGQVVLTRTPIDSTLTLQNSGDFDLSLTGTAGELIMLSGTNADQFSITQDDITSPLSPNSSQNFILRFEPTSEGLKEATLTIISNDRDEGTYNINLRATAVIVTALEDDLKPETFITYPNPTKGKLKVDNLPAGTTSFVLTDAAGKEILNGQAESSLEIDLTQLPTGMYQLTLNTNRETFTKKIIKN